MLSEMPVRSESRRTVLIEMEARVRTKTVLTTTQLEYLEELLTVEET